MYSKLLCTMLVSGAAAADAATTMPDRRRLRDRLDLVRLARDSDEGKLGTKLLFKLDAGHKLVGKGKTDKLANQVAKVIDCEDDARRVFRAAGKHEAAHVAAGLNLWYEVKCADTAGDKAAASKKTFEALQKYLDSDDHDGVLLVEPELEHATSGVPDDPLYGSQPHYDAIHLPEARDVVAGNPAIVVQVLDTGIDLDHEDLQMNIWQNPGEICGNGIDDDDNGFVDDCHGYNHADDTGDNLFGGHWHGTHCGGTIAADTDNGLGVAGVAGGDGTTDSGVKLMISVGFGATNTGGFAEALVYGADNGAQISSNSWGYTSPGVYGQAELDAIDYYNTKDGIVVFAAGNDNSDADYYPGYYDGTVAVAAVDTAGVRASFSNYGDWIEISAPGVDVYSTMSGGDYGHASGTSMACPHVAGVLALGKAVDPSRSKDDLLFCAFTTAQDVDPINGDYAGKLGAGNIDAAAFVACVANGAPSRAPTLSAAPTPAPTTAKPTYTVAPTASCGGECDQVLTVKIMTDMYPNEISWALNMAPAPPACADASTTGGGYDSALTEYEQVVATNVCAGETYTWEITDSWGDGICCSQGEGHYEIALDGVVLHSGGDYGSGETFTFTAPTARAPTAAPVAPPTAQPPLAAPTDVELRSHPKMGTAMLLTWRGAASTDVRFRVQYRLSGTDHWVDDTAGYGDVYVPEWDGQIYHILSDAAIPCGSKVEARVAATHEDSQSDYTEAPKNRKLKC